MLHMDGQEPSGFQDSSFCGMDCYKPPSPQPDPKPQADTDFWKATGDFFKEWTYGGLNDSFNVKVRNI